MELCNNEACEHLLERWQAIMPLVEASLQWHKAYKEYEARPFEAEVNVFIATADTLHKQVEAYLKEGK